VTSMSHRLQQELLGSARVPPSLRLGASAALRSRTCSIARAFCLRRHSTDPRTPVPPRRRGVIPTRRSRPISNRARRR
jgi:hypothetical protein